MQEAPPQDRIERLADRVLAVAKALAGQGDGRTFTVDAIYDEITDVSKQRLSDALKTLKDARRIWHWGGAASLSQLATDGTSAPENCKFHAPVDEVLLTEAIEIIPITDKARESIASVKAWRK